MFPRSIERGFVTVNHDHPGAYGKHRLGASQADPRCGASHCGYLTLK